MPQKSAMDDMQGEDLAGGMRDEMSDDMAEQEPEEEGEGGDDDCCINIPQGVRKFDEARTGDRVKVMVELLKRDGNRGEILMVDGKKMMKPEEDGGDEEGEGGEDGSGRDFLAKIDQMPGRGELPPKERMG